MAYEAALESVIYGIGYEMTPSEEELNRGSSTVSKDSAHKIRHKSSFQVKSEMENTEGPGSSSKSKLRRAFSLHSYRKPFRTTTTAPTSTSSPPEGAPTTTTGGDSKSQNHRRLSWRKFLSKIAAQLGGSYLVAKQQAAAQQAVANHNQQHDRVPPLGGYQWPADQTPGVTGLRNHGNTCFMNAVLQCLSHTDILAEYFVLDQYKVDLKRRNKINSKKFGTKGELTEQLALVLKALWTCRDTPEHSSSFKAVVDRYSSQFRSSTQHDAQEFLFWLLDKVHEDLNTATKKRYKTIKNNYGRPDEVIAAETLANHIRCNNSFVQAVFQAQFRSSLTCPRCEKQSNTFDPFHCISVQLPQLVQQPVYVTVVYSSQQPKQVKLGLTVAPGSSMLALKEQLHLDTGIATDRILLTEVIESGFSRVFCDSHPISALKESDPVYCIETPKILESSGSAASCSGSKEHTKIVLCILNVRRKEKAAESGKNEDEITVGTDEKSGTKKSEKSKDKIDEGFQQFGSPLCIQVNRDISYSELQRLLLKEMASVLRSEVFAFTTPVTEMYKIRLQDPSADPETYLEAAVEHPLFTEMIDLALSVVPSDAGPPHVKLLLEWSKPERFFSDMSDPTVEHASVAKLKADKVTPPSLSLEQCLDHYTKAETLSAEDAWRCPHCQKYLPVVKTLGMWSLPDILVIHFKRFRQHQMKGPQAAKLTTMVKFPMFGFDMAPHLAKPDNNEKGGGSIGPSDTKYDLYAVCYHQGNTLETGHYTAACCNPYDQQWYRFDDQRVMHVPKEKVEEEIINEEAYMLFYQRRKVDGSECSSGSASSTSSGEHWISRIAPPSVLSKVAETLANKSEIVVEEKETVEVKVEEKAVVEGGVEEGIVDKENKPIEMESGIIESVVDVVEGEAVVEKGEEREVGVEKAEEVVVSERKTSVPRDEVEESSADAKKGEEEEINEQIEIVKEKDILAMADEVDNSVVVVRKSSPIPIQRSSAPLNWSKAFDDSINTNLRHSSLSYTNSMRARDIEATNTVKLLRASSSCSKDTFLFMDHHHPHQRHLHHRSAAGRSLIDEDGVLGAANHSLWISPVSSHKMITVSPKN